MKSVGRSRRQAPRPGARVRRPVPASRRKSSSRGLKAGMPKEQWTPIWVDPRIRFFPLWEALHAAGFEFGCVENENGIHLTLRERHKTETKPVPC